MNERLRGLLLLLAAVVAVKLIPELYRWAAYADERRELAALRERAVASGAELVTARARLDTLRREIERSDRRLRSGRREVERFGRFAHNGTLPPGMYGRYVAELDRYNRKVAARNGDLERYNVAWSHSTAAAQLYRARADSARALAARIGDPYYQVPSPVEAAAERGLIDAP